MFILPPNSTAKLMLNSFWGKFGERINKPTTLTVKDPAHLFNLITDAALDISTLRLCTDDILEASIPVSKTMPSKAPRPTSLWRPSPCAMLDSSSTSL